MATTTPTVNKRYPKYGWHNIKRDFKLNYALTLMILPVFAFYIIFHYGPMYGLQIAFRDYNPVDGVTGSPWVGLKHFISFFNNFYFGRLIRNTLLISVETLVFGFPAPIIFAILLNEIRTSWYKRTLQTLSYLPYFISTVVMCGIIVNFTRRCYQRYRRSLWRTEKDDAPVSSVLPSGIRYFRNLAVPGLELHHLSGSDFRYRYAAV